MIERKLEQTILKMLENFRVVAINGPRQSGKTTLQKLIAKNKNLSYYTFDDIDIYNTANNDPKNIRRFPCGGKVFCIIPHVIRHDLPLSEAERLFFKATYPPY